MTKFNNFPKAQIIQVNGIELEVFEAGTENRGQPIVLCHGWPEHAYAWRHQVSPLVNAGYHVIIPNQRGYGNSSRPSNVEDYSIESLTDDLVSLLNYYNYDDAIFVGHDWGASVVWGLAMLHPAKVRKIINLSLPYQPRGEIPWLDFMRQILGEDNYFVHFNDQPGVADKILNNNTEQFFRNLYRKELPIESPRSENLIIRLACSTEPLGKPIMSEGELKVFVNAFKKSGFNCSINWYRNINRNWDILGTVDPILKQETLMIYGEKDPIPRLENLNEFVQNVEEASLDCGHWIQQEKPEELNSMIYAKAVIPKD